jgi:hypothetical protein
MLTQVQSSSSSELAYTFEQPRRDFFPSLVDALLDAFPDSQLDSFLDDIANGRVLRWDWHREKGAKRGREGETRICNELSRVCLVERHVRINSAAD